MLTSKKPEASFLRRIGEEVSRKVHILEIGVVEDVIRNQFGRTTTTVPPSAPPAGRETVSKERSYHVQRSQQKASESEGLRGLVVARRAESAGVV